ncbi:hypothetical protein C0J52_24197 [Blattella germanica]|nr:hypothetical protein C0J52_24197 [Blattella germanica]
MATTESTWQTGLYYILNQYTARFFSYSPLLINLFSHFFQEPQANGDSMPASFPVNTTGFYLNVVRVKEKKNFEMYVRTAARETSTPDFMWQFQRTLPDPEATWKLFFPNCTEQPPRGVKRIYRCNQ